MESAPLNILLISGDSALCRRVAELLASATNIAGVTAEASADAGIAMLATNHFHAVLFDVPQVNATAVFQISLLTARLSQLPVIALGPDDEVFLEETIYSGAQEYLGRTELSTSSLCRAIYCAIVRQQEKLTLLTEKNDYHGVFDHLVEGIFRTTVDGHYQLANPALARIYGYDSPSELIANIQNIATGLYVEQGRRGEFQRLMQEHDTLSGFESRIYRKDGSIIWIAENCRAVRDAQGKLLYYEGTVEDITARLQMESALKNSESLYHSLVETMPQGVFRRDLQGRFTFANQPYCKYHRVQPEDVLGKTDFDLYPKAAADKYWRDDLNIMAKGETVEIMEETQPVGAPEKNYHHVIKTPLRDETGQIIGLQGMVWDITEKKLAEEKLRRTTEELSRSQAELQAKNGVMQENLRTAREIQLAMLPQQYPVFPKGVPAEKSAFQFAHRYYPAETVSGDFCSISPLSDTEVGVFICDVTGHGVRAALITAVIRALSEELKPLARDPGLYLRKLNYDLFNILKNSGQTVHTTAFYAVADCQNGTLRFANAGHPKPLLLHRLQNHIEILANASGRSQPALGLFAEAPYVTTETTIAPGDFLMLFTDGLYEVMGQNEELYSQQRLMLDVKNLMTQPPGMLFDELTRVVRNFAHDGQFEDDVCLVGMDFIGLPITAA